MNPVLAVENGLDAPEAPGRVLDPLHRHALPPRRRGGDGLLGQLGGVPAERVRGRLLLPQALSDVRADRARGDARRVAARAGRNPRAHTDPPDRLVRPDG